MSMILSLLDRLPDSLALILLVGGSIFCFLALYAAAGWAYARFTPGDGAHRESAHLGVMQAAYDDDQGPRCGYWKCKSLRMSPSHSRDGWVCPQCGKFVPFEQWYEDFKRKDEAMERQIAPWLKIIVGALALILVSDVFAGLFF